MPLGPAEGRSAHPHCGPRFTPHSSVASSQEPEEPLSLSWPSAPHLRAQEGGGEGRQAAVRRGAGQSRGSGWPCVNHTVIGPMRQGQALVLPAQNLLTVQSRGRGLAGRLGHHWEPASPLWSHPDPPFLSALTPPPWPLPFPAPQALQMALPLFLPQALDVCCLWTVLPEALSPHTRRGWSRFPPLGISVLGLQKQSTTN